MSYHFQMQQKRCSRHKSNKRKTFFVITIMTLLLIFTSLGYFFEGKGQASAGENDFLEQVVVEKGDTLWSIAKAHQNRGEDTRYVIYKIRKTNGLKDSVIYPGQELLIPQ